MSFCQHVTHKSTSLDSNPEHTTNQTKGRIHKMCSVSRINIKMFTANKSNFRASESNIAGNIFIASGGKTESFEGFVYCLLLLM